MPASSSVNTVSLLLLPLPTSLQAPLSEWLVECGFNWKDAATPADFPHPTARPDVAVADAVWLAALTPAARLALEDILTDSSTLIVLDEKGTTIDIAPFRCRMLRIPADAAEIAWQLEEIRLAGTQSDLLQQQEDILLHAPELLLHAVDAHAVISMADPGGNIIYVNDRFCDLSGFSRMELLGARHSIVKSGLHAPAFYADLWRTISRGHTWHGEVCNRKKSGELYWVSATIVPITDQAGRPIRYVSIRTDITRLKETKAQLQASHQQAIRDAEQLKESEARLKFFTDNVEEGIVVCHQGIIVDTSDRWLELFRCRRDDAIGRPIMDYTAPSAVPMVLQLIEEKWAESYESVMLRHDSTTFPAIVRGRNLEFGGRELRLTSILDISRQKEAELAVQAAKTEAERANQAKTEFLSSMSHELRTPMNAIFGFAQILEFDDRLDEDQQDSVREILKAARHLLGLINEVLDLAKIESGRISLSIETVLLAAVVHECEQLLRPLAAERQIALRMQVQACGAVLADRVRLKQVLLNLLSNAIKYNRPEGEVKLTIEPFAQGLRIVVADTGPGIAAPDIEHLFQPFNRLGEEHGTTEGTGIGLVISRRLIEAMGGKIGVESEPGLGSRFWVELPQADPATAAEDLPEIPTRAVQDARSQQQSILYIDDNPVNLKLVAQVLGKQRHIHLATAHTPELGIELALTDKPSLILLDINLPGMSGYEVLRILKGNLHLHHIPVLAISANAMQKDIERGIAAGFSDYLTKPLDVGRFLSCIDRYIMKDAQS